MTALSTALTALRSKCGDSRTDARHEARVFLVALMEAHGWHLTRAARAAGVHRRTLRRDLDRYAPGERARAIALGRLRPGTVRARPDRDAEIARRYAAGGVTQVQLAAEYGLDQARVSRICRRARGA